MGTLSINRLSAGLLGLCCAALALWLCWHHPLAPTLATAGVLLLGAAQAAWPPLWLIALPALLPWLGLNPWTGWLLVEEVDLAILAVAAGAYLRWALLPGPQVRASRASRLTRRWGLLLLLVWTVSVVVSMHRGAVDAGGWSWGWWQGYREPLNALRLAKPTLAVLLLLPLWWRLQQRPGQRCADQLSLGLALGLGGTALWCIWERITGPGLLNMATDYRTTGPFWEMQVGGAALDIFLALSLPIAIRLVWTARSPPTMAGAGALVLAGAFAGFTTFSRIVYLALPVGFAVFALLQHRQGAAAGRATGQVADTGNGALTAAGLCAAVGALSVWLFPLAGYRGLIALLACTLSLMLLVPRGGLMPVRDWAGAWVLGLVLGALLMPLALQFGKGPYLVFAAVTLATGALLLAPTTSPALRVLAVVGFVLQLGGLVAVALHWGGPPAAPPAAVAALTLASAGWLLGRRSPAPWRPDPRWLGATATGLVVVLAGVAVFSAGDYMAVRLSQTTSDRAERWEHFRLGLSLPDAPNARWLGQGLGRYPELYALHGPAEMRPGDIRFGDAGVRLVAGNHPLSYGSVLRLSQRIALPSAQPLKLTLETRAEGPVKLVASVCAKHLLYGGDCLGVEGSTTHMTRDWQTTSLVLSGAKDWAVPAFPPRLIVFSMANDSHGQPVDLRRVSLTDASGHDYLRNGQFAQGGARWFISSDRNHLPWHAKNLQVHLLVEQGWLGLLSLIVFTLAALGCLLGPLRMHALAPPLAAAIVGCWIVGAVDSVLDMPRVATWLLLLTGMAMSLHLPSRAVRQPAARQ